MKVTNNTGDAVPIGQRLSPNVVSSTRIGIHLIELLAKGISWKIQNNPGCCQYCSLKADNMALFLKTASIQLIEHGEVELVPTRTLQPYILLSLAKDSTLHFQQRGNINTQ